MARRPAQPGDRTGILHLVDLVKSTVPPVHRAGYPFILGAASVAVAGRKRAYIRVPAVALTAFTTAFFRHPTRVTPPVPNAVVSAADGQVALVDTAVPPAELGLGTEPLPRVSTFLSVLDVHVQRVPVAGKAVSITHVPGAFLSADLPAASERNEHNSMLIETSTGAKVAVIQIAGLLARRIVCDVTVGDQLSAGDTYGLIRFGSRVDLYFPAGTTISAWVGQRLIGGETIVATLN